MCRRYPIREQPNHHHAGCRTISGHIPRGCAWTVDALAAHTRKRSDAVRTRIDKAIKALRRERAAITFSSVARRAGGPQKHLRPCRTRGAIHAHRPLAAITDDIPPTTGTDNSIVAGATGPADRQRRPDRRTQSRATRPRPHHRSPPRRTRPSSALALPHRAPLPSLATLDTWRPKPATRTPALGHQHK